MLHIHPKYIKHNDHVDLWDMGPKRVEAPVAPVEPVESKELKGADLALAKIHYEDALETYRADLRAYGAAKVEFKKWHDVHGGPFKRLRCGRPTPRTPSTSKAGTLGAGPAEGREARQGADRRPTSARKCRKQNCSEARDKDPQFGKGSPTMKTTPSQSRVCRGSRWPSHSPRRLMPRSSICARTSPMPGAGHELRLVRPRRSRPTTSMPRVARLIAQADIGYFLTQGYIVASSDNSFIFTTGALPASGTTDIVGPAIPPGAYIQQIIWQNTTANAVTGGMSVGTTANGTDVVAAQALAANALVFTTDALLLKRVFSTTASTVLHFAPVTSSNTANLTITILYAYF